MDMVFCLSENACACLHEKIDRTERSLVDAVCDDAVESVNVHDALVAVQGVREQLRCAYVKYVDSVGATNE